MLKKILVFFVLFIFLFSSPSFALKKRVWTKSSTAVSSYPWITVKLDRYHQNLILSFGSLNKSTSVSYELTYTGNETEQGIFGSIDPSKETSASRTLYFGTCSHKVCTLHKNIKNTRLEVRFKLTSGKTLIKRFRIKV